MYEEVYTLISNQGNANEATIKTRETNMQHSDLIVRAGEAKDQIHCWWESQSSWSLRKASWHHPIKVKIHTLYFSAVPLLGLYPRDTTAQRETYTKCWELLNIKATLEIILKTHWKLPRCWERGDWITSSMIHRRQWTVAACSNMHES